MIEHHEEHHKGEESPNFKVELVKKCRKPLERQIIEGIKIDKFKGITMNRKGEWGQNLPPKFTIGAKERPKRALLRREQTQQRGISQSKKK